MKGRNHAPDLGRDHGSGHATGVGRNEVSGRDHVPNLGRDHAPDPGLGEASEFGLGEASDAAPDLGDLVVVLLAGTLAGLRDRLVEDGFEGAAELVAELVDVTDDYLSRIAA